MKFLVTAVIEDEDEFEVEAEDYEAAWEIAEEQVKEEYGGGWIVLDVDPIEDDEDNNGIGDEEDA